MSYLTSRKEIATVFLRNEIIAMVTEAQNSDDTWCFFVSFSLKIVVCKGSIKGILCDFFIFTLDQIIVLNKYCT